uniref:Uncharacterized protein n=1 Tax=Panagrolaimus sp. ES5 TaxID=591445 RepID=A0AC34FVS8_9BILA
MVILYISKIKDIPSECYHPEVLPHQDYLAIKRQYHDARSGIMRINTFIGLNEMAREDRNSLAKAYQEIIDNILPILKTQNTLRALCLLKKIFGFVETPVIYKKRLLGLRKMFTEDNNIDQDIIDYDNDDDDDDIESDSDDDASAVNDENDQSSEFQPPKPFEISLKEYENVSQNNEFFTIESI